MSKDKSEYEYDFKNLTSILLKNEGIKKGYFLTLVLPDISGGQIKSINDESPTQGLIVEFNKIKLIEVDEATENAVDASVI